MRVIVTGGRDYADQWAVFIALDNLLAKHGEVTVVEGGAKGADRHAALWAMNAIANGDERVKHETFEADWRGAGYYNPRAGRERNQRMVDSGADLVLAFPGGTGTADCVRRAVQAEIPVDFPASPAVYSHA